MDVDGESPDGGSSKKRKVSHSSVVLSMYIYNWPTQRAAPKAEKEKPASKKAKPASKAKKSKEVVEEEKEEVIEEEEE